MLQGNWFDSLRTYLARDIMYVVGGGLVLFAFIRILGLDLRTSLPTVVWLFLGALCYAIGFVVQEAVAFTTHLVQSAPITHVNRRFWWACRRYGIRNPDWEILREHEGDRQTQLQIYREWENRFLEACKDNLLSEFQRTNNLLHVGTVLGSNGLVAALLLLGAWAIYNRDVDLYLFAGILGFAFICIPLGWVKGIQCTHHIMDYNKRAESNQSQTDSNEIDQHRL